jgi:glycosyltransferase involved in cell wall biosynthesis
MTSLQAAANDEKATGVPLTPYRMLTAMNCSRDVRGGMPTANASLSAALSELGWTVDHVYLEDLPGFVGRRLANYPAFGPALVARLQSLEAQRGPYDIVQVSGGDGFVAPFLRRNRLGHRRLLVAKSHGLEHRYWSAFLEQVRLGHEHVTMRHRLYFGVLRLAQVEQAVRRSDLFNCHTRHDADFVIARGWKAPKDVCIIGEGAPSEWFQASSQERPYGGRLLWSGSWNWMKGSSVLPEIFARLAEDPELTLTLIGTGVDPTEVVSAFEPQVRPRVRVQPRLSHEEVLTAFRTHDLLLATSHFEGFWTVVIEAMAAGLPVVAADIAAAHDNIADGETGYLVRPGDIDGFVEKVRIALNRLRRGDGLPLRLAASQAVSALTWGNLAVRTVSTYEEALIRVRGLSG